LISRRLRLVFLALFFVSIAALCSVLIAPDEFYLAGVLALTIPVWLTLDALALAYLAWKRSRWMYLPLAALLASAPLLLKSFSFRKKGDPQSYFKLISYNTNALGYFRDSTTYQANREAFTDWVLKNAYEVYCFQEFADVNKQPLEIPGYTRLSSVKVTKEGHHLGLFIYTRLPVVRQDKIEFAFNSYNRVMWADLAFANDTIRVVNAHLVSYDFFANSIRENLKKIRNALRARSWHSKLLEQFIKESPHPLVLCGDFNELPQSYPYLKLNGLLNDTFATSGEGYGYTYRFKGMPVRIDHIFASDELETGDYEIIQDRLWSDHRPLSIRIGPRGPDE
jgi:endonuclease/exonuclease/phosphatase family metal-dependent hydrolase